MKLYDVVYRIRKVEEIISPPNRKPRTSVKYYSEYAHVIFGFRVSFWYNVTGIFGEYFWHTEEHAMQAIKRHEYYKNIKVEEFETIQKVEVK